MFFISDGQQILMSVLQTHVRMKALVQITSMDTLATAVLDMKVYTVKQVKFSTHYK